MLERTPRIRLHQDGRLAVLVPGLNEDELREGQLLFEVQCVPGARLRFDDRPLSVVWSDDGRTGYGQLDLTNQVGFHRFSVGTPKETVSFDVRTTTAKATHTEVESMARVVAGQVFSFKHQFVYTDATGQRRTVPLPEVALGWLRDRLVELAQLVRAIDARPATETRQQFNTSHQARGVSVPRTLRLLRENPGLLEAMPDGPLDIGGRKFWPAAVVVRERNREPARIEHMQLAHFLSRVARLLVDLRVVVPRDMLETIAEWEVQIRAMRATSIVRRHDVPNAHAAWTPLSTPLQKTDLRYRRVRELHSEFLQDIDVSDYSPDSVRANVRDVWEIYQSFAAHMIGRAFGLKYASGRGDLRERRSDGCSMYSDEYELFYDCRAPARVMTSWRDATARPADERPDIVVRRRQDGAVAVLDAKFKVDRNGAAKPEDLFEMQGYMNSFSVRAGGIVFPGSSAVPRYLEAQDVALAELPLRAAFFVAEEDRTLSSLRTSIQGLFRVPQSLSLASSAA
jgi:hypothetical protein